MEFRLLGPIEMCAGGQLINAGEPRRRAVLAALLIDAGQVVSSAALIDRVWGDDPPAQAVRTLGTHITRIRRSLESAADGTQPPAVVNQAGGYRLVVERDHVDLHQFRGLVQQAREPRCTDEDRVALLRRAVALWRGEPLAGVPGDWAYRLREHLNSERLDATAAWAEAELRVGNPAAVLAPLAPLADEHPMMEPLTVMLVRALVATGRPSEALQHCRTHRQRLADDQGTDQGPELRALYEEILRGEQQPTQVVSRRAVPAQRPVAVPAGPRRSGPVPQPDPGSATAKGSASTTPRVAAVTGAAPAGDGDGDGGPRQRTAPPPTAEREDRTGSREHSPWSRRRVALVAAGMSVMLAAGVVAAVRFVGQPSPPRRTAPVSRQVAGDDFSGAALDPSQWGAPYEMARENGSSWSPAMVRVSGGELQIVGVGRNPTGKGNVAGGVCWCADEAPIRSYGIWQIRAKFDVGSGYGPVIGLWPDDDESRGWLTVARVDQAARTSMYSVIKSPGGGELQGPPAVGDFTSWYTYSIERRPGFVKISLNDTVVLDTRTVGKPVALSTAPMFLYVQLVPGPDGPVPAPDADTPSQVVVHVDWVRYLN